MAIRSLRLRLVLKRWRDIVLLALGGSSLVLLVVEWFSDEIGPLRSLSLPVLSALLVLVALLGITARYPRRKLGLEHFFAYPPLWFAAVIGTLLLLLVLRSSEPVRNSFGFSQSDRAFISLTGLIVGLTIGLAPLAAFLLQAAVTQRRRRALKNNCVANESGALSERPSFEELANWCSNDAPVQKRESDLFGYAEIAARISERFLADEAPAQAVVGLLGSGKTTIRHLVAEHVQTRFRGESPAVSLVPVELWPYEKSRAAVEGVIRELLKVLGQDVSVLALRGLPEAYGEAMSAAGGAVGAFSRLLQMPMLPSDVLNRINDIACSLGKRYVVWIEDLERFAGTAVVPAVILADFGGEIGGEIRVFPRR